MNAQKTKILIIYANSDNVMRQSVEAMLHSFDLYLPNCETYYHNSILNRAPLLPVFRKVDYVIFHHSVTTVWDRKRYIRKIKSWLSCDFGAARKIALMQDEYKNIDLLRRFVVEMSIDDVFTLAPKQEWASIYGQAIIDKGILQQYLAGYLQSSSCEFNSDFERNIDIGYRADWTKMHVKLGKTGFLKKDIAVHVQKHVGQHKLKSDVKVGSEYFIRGADWRSFLKRCRYVIGVPSGSSVLDETGVVERRLFERLRENSVVSETILYRDIVEPREGSLCLEVLSPRHFEAVLYGCGQILVESEYNGILQPWKHYLPLKRDFSNIEEILTMVPDETLRRKMVDTCEKELVVSKHYSYSTFVERILPGVRQVGEGKQRNRSLARYFNDGVEGLKLGLVGLKSKLT